MDIKGSFVSHQTTTFRPNAQTLSKTTDTNPQNDTFTFSDSKLTGKEKLQIGTIAVGGTLMGAVPLLGMLSNGMAASINYDDGDGLGCIIGTGGAISNVAASIATYNGHAWAMAIPAVLGGISWAGYAHGQAMKS